MRICYMAPCIAVLALFGVSMSVVADADAGSPVKIVCFGDSITAGAYPVLLGAQMPNATIVNAGVGGNTTGAGLKRMEADVLATEPDIVLIMFGTNDSVLTAPGTYRTPLEDFAGNLTRMVTRCREAGAIPVLATLLPIIEAPYYTRHPKAYYEPEGGLSAIVARYRGATLAVAEKLGVPLVDMNTRIAGNETHLKPDGVHPNPEGEAAIATLFLGAINELLTNPSGSVAPERQKPGEPDS